jgi:hypothetical protein
MGWISVRATCGGRVGEADEHAPGEEARQCESPINGHARRLASRTLHQCRGPKASLLGGIRA